MGTTKTQIQLPLHCGALDQFLSVGPTSANYYGPKEKEALEYSEKRWNIHGIDKFYLVTLTYTFLRSARTLKNIL